jgi:serine protease
MYVKFGAQPTLTSYDCRPYVNGNGETCTLQAHAGTYDILVNAYQGYTGLSILATYQ